RAGSQADAEKNAGRAYAAMMLGAGVMAFSRLIPKKSANLRVLKNLRERGPDAGEPALNVHGEREAGGLPRGQASE
ncbi:MAG: hypothetical protein AAB307_03305, partial [Deltaproteobacteria bacterium]